jgi:hypothetical protein
MQSNFTSLLTAASTRAHSQAGGAYAGWANLGMGMPAAAAAPKPAKPQRPKDNGELKKQILEELRKPGKSMHAAQCRG